VSCPYESGVIPPGEFFAKPITSGGGTGVFPVSFDGRHVTFGGRRAPWADFIDYLKSLGKRYLLCRKAEQHHKLAGIYPASTNTVRVLMLRQPQTLRKLPLLLDAWKVELSGRLRPGGSNEEI